MAWIELLPPVVEKICKIRRKGPGHPISFCDWKPLVILLLSNPYWAVEELYLRFYHTMLNANAHEFSVFTDSRVRGNFHPPIKPKSNGIFFKLKDACLENSMESKMSQPVVKEHGTTTARAELVVMGAIFLILSFISIQLDLFERIEETLEKYDRFQIDEFIVVLAFFSIFISLYAYRRWLEMRRALKKREMSDQELLQANSDLRQKTNALEFHNRWNEKISKLTNFLQVCKSRDEVFQFISQSAGKLFKETKGALYMTRESRNQLVKVASWGEIEAGPDFFAPDDCWGLRLGKRYLSKPGSDNPLCNHSGREEGQTRVCIPLTAYGEIIGLFHMESDVDSSNSQDRWTTPSLEQLSISFAEQISLAISNLTLREQLQDLAIHDPLTGLYNRQYLNEAFERERSRAKRNHTQIGFAIIDLDHFKRFNDTFGHSAGDALLQEMGRLLKDFFRMEDFCCRFGGEEFLVLISEIPGDGLKARCEMLLQQISQLKVSYLDQQLGKVTASVGVAVYPDHGEDFSQLLKIADEALYRAKNEGRDRVCFAQSHGNQREKYPE
jgi:diguanylate cyclase (GGDEF)-like protein